MNGARLILAAGIALLTLAVGGGAEARRKPSEIYDMVLGQPAPPPVGYYDFCQREPGDCFTAEQMKSANIRVATQLPGPAGALAEPSLDLRTSAPLKPNYWSFAFRSAAAQRRVSYRARDPGAAPPATTAPAVKSVWGKLHTRLFNRYGRFPPELDAHGRIVITRDVTYTLNRINREVNRRVISVSDQVNYGQLDVWGLPLSRNTRGWGDCEDYAVEKRHLLLQAGYPMKLLSLALVRTRWGDTHAVLLVETDQGALALDSFSGWLTPWWKLDYQWILRQSLKDPSVWLPVLTEGRPGGEVSTPG